MLTDLWSARPWLAAMFLCPLIALPAHALDPSRALSQFGHSAWRSLDGDFTGNPTSVTQTLDGYVWVGTSTGVKRFDGARFDVLTPPPNESLARPTVMALHGARDGSLWIGTGVDVEQWKDGHLVHHDLKARIHSIAEDADGDIWAVRAGNDDGQGPVCRTSGVRPHCFGASDGVNHRYSVSLATSSDGGVWFASSTTVTRLRGTSVDSFPVEARKLDDNLDGVDVLATDRDGSLLVGLVVAGHGGGLQRLTGGHWQSVDVPGMRGASLKVDSLLVDREGALWVGTSNDGLYRVFNGRAERYRSADGLSSDTVLALFEDAEGNLWVCTTAGVDRLRDTRVASFSSREGLGEDAVQSLSTGSEGSLWIGNTHSIDRLRDGRTSSLTAAESASGNEFTAVHEDRAGRLWAGVDNDLAVLVEAHFKRIAMPDRKPLGVVIDIAQDADGSIWALALGHPRRLVRVRGDRVVEDLQPPGPVANRLLATPDGDLWLFTLGGGLARYRGGRFEVVVAPVEKNYPMSGVGTGSGSEFIAVGTRGLLGWHDGVVRRMTMSDGLPCELIYAAVFDRHHAIWLYAACGLLRVSAEDLASWWAHPGFRVTPLILDATDGAKPQSTFFGRSAQMSKDGRLWFANGQQLQMVDPEHILGNHVAPPVHVQALVADHRIFEPSATPVVLPTKTLDLEIDYTAPSFVVPQKVRFRYLLEGHDDQWQDAGTRRQAFYTDLPPGRYRFRVIACNNDGVWNDLGATTVFSIPPTFVQTRWFIVLCVLGSGLLVWLGLRLRLRQLSTQIRIRIQERVSERERIARELHDTLLQATQGLVLMVHGALKMIGPDDAAGKALRSAVSQADAVISEGRDRIQGLRAHESARGRLAERLGELGERLAATDGAAFAVAVVGEARELNATVDDELRRIASEAIVNAFRHAGATRIDVSIEFNRNDLRVAVHDDGVGIGSEALAPGGVPGHWGIHGMRERALRIGASVEFRSAPGAGTQFIARTPGPTAYANFKGRWRWVDRVRWKA